MLTPARQQRAQGDISVSFRARAGETALETLRQSGCLKARLPRLVDQGWREVVALNNSGGVAGGDKLSTRLELGQGTAALLTTASAERIYRCGEADMPATIRNAVVLGQAARGEWLPQETILFQGSRLDRALEIAMAGDASLLGVEALVLGRVAMGEVVHSAFLHDVIRIRRDGRLILHDAIRPPAELAAALARRAVASGARASATLFWVAPGAAAALQTVREALAEHGEVHAGASAWDGMLVVRLLARDPARCRAAVVALLHLLRQGRMLPRVWSC